MTDQAEIDHLRLTVQRLQASRKVLLDEISERHPVWCSFERGGRCDCWVQPALEKSEKVLGVK